MGSKLLPAPGQEQAGLPEPRCTPLPLAQPEHPGLGAGAPGTLVGQPGVLEKATSEY